MLLNYQKNLGDNRNKAWSKSRNWVDTNIYNKRVADRGNPDSDLSKEIKGVKKIL